MGGLGSAQGKMERLVLLASALSLGTPRSLHELRDRHGLYTGGSEESSRRAFERDKAELRSNGIEIESVDLGDGPAYWIRSQPATSLSLTREELDALAVLAATVGDAATGVSLATFAGRAGQFPADDSAGRVSLDDLTIPDEIVTALAQRRQLTFSYRDADGVASDRTTEPWTLVHRNGLTYLVARDLDRGEQRNFRLDRIVPGSAALGAPAAHERPTSHAPVHPTDVADFVVEVPPVARLDAEELGGVIEEVAEDGWLRATFTAERPEPLVAWALRHDAVIRQPAAHADEQRSRLQRLIDRHEGEPPEVKRPRAAPGGTVPRNLSVERLRRLMILPSYLGEMAGVTREELAGSLGCSVEELDAELELLDMLELPGYGHVGEVTEDRGQLVYVRHIHDPSVHVTPADALRLSFLVEVVRPLFDQEAAGLEAIGDKLRAMVPADIRVDLSGGHHRDLETIRQAIRDHQVIRFGYRGRKDAEWRDRQVAPSRFMIAHGAVYLAGTDVVADQERQFRLDRMGPVEVVGSTPAVEVENRTPTYVATDPEVTALLLLAPRATWLLTQVRAHAVEHHDDGSAVVAVRTDAVDWLVSHVMAAGGEAEVVAPYEVRDRVVARAREQLRRVTS